MGVCNITYCYGLWVVGNRGPEGEKGSHGPTKELNLGLLVVHSQSANTPRCPGNMNTLWEGFSLLYLEGQERAHTQDLGKYIFINPKTNSYSKAAQCRTYLGVTFL